MDVPVVIGGNRSEGKLDPLPVRSPATGDVVGTMQRADGAQVDAAVVAARQAADQLAALSPRQRAHLVDAVADAIDADQEPIAQVLSAEQGKPIGEARGEVATAIEMWRTAAEIARHLTDEIVPSDDPDRGIVVVRRPHGVLGVITPWNFPATIPTEYLCAALAAGNAVVWKPSELTPMTAVRIIDCIERAGLPAGSVNLVPGLGTDVGAAIVGHPGVDAVGFTGSPATGAAIAASAGPKPLLLELGGNNATVVLGDVDVPKAAARLASAAYANAGQICSSTERIIVERSIHDELAEALTERARLLRLGLPTDETTTIGPLNNEATAAKADQHLADARSRGARILTGGRRAADHPTPLYYEPTVLTGLTTDMVAFGEETFGPVAALMPFDRDDEAVELVNGHGLGLVGGVLGEDLDRAMTIGRSLRTGIVNIGEVATYWQPHTPFGGWSGRASGVGRLGGRYTIDALTQLQTFVVPRGRLP